MSYYKYKTIKPTLISHKLRKSWKNNKTLFQTQNEIKQLDAYRIYHKEKQFVMKLSSWCWN